MELTINNMIKIVIAVIVIVLIIFAVYMGMKNYIVPFFKGLGFELKDVLINKLTNSL